MSRVACLHLISFLFPPVMLSVSGFFPIARNCKSKWVGMPLCLVFLVFLMLRWGDILSFGFHNPKCVNDFGDGFDCEWLRWSLWLPGGLSEWAFLCLHFFFIVIVVTAVCALCIVELLCAVSLLVLGLFVGLWVGAGRDLEVVLLCAVSRGCQCSVHLSDMSKCLLR